MSLLISLLISLSAHATTPCVDETSLEKQTTLLAETLSSKQSVALRKRCGFGSLAELKAEAASKVKTFSNLKSFDPGMSIADSALKAPLTAKLEQHVDGLVQWRKENRTLPWQDSILKMTDGLRDDPRLSAFKKRYLQVDFSTGIDKNCDAPACTSYGDYSIVVPPDEVLPVYYLGTKKFERAMKAIIGHEVAHFVYDTALASESPGKSYHEAMNLRQPASYHLLVDAVGMELTGLSVEDFIGALEDTMKVMTSTGDIRDRINCLQILTGHGGAETDGK
jgi:hypothetical protein